MQTSLQDKPKRDRATGNYSYNGWVIEPRGGLFTMRRFCAKKGNKFVWAFRLKEAIALCDKLDAGEPVDKLYLEPLYL